MKRITLLLFVAVMSMAMSAQAAQNIKLPKPDLGKARHAISIPRTDFTPSMTAGVPKLAEAVVTPPEDLETRDYRLNAYIFDGSSWEVVGRTLSIGFDGNDVYLQGFSVYLPEAWIKGTLNDDLTQVTFPAQYYGSLYGNDLYFYPTTPVDGEYVSIDAVFNFNERADVFVLDQEQVCYIFENAYADHVGWYYMYDSEMNITPAANTVEVPEGLETLNALPELLAKKDPSGASGYEQITKALEAQGESVPEFRGNLEFVYATLGGDLDDLELNKLDTEMKQRAARPPEKKQEPQPLRRKYIRSIAVRLSSV